MNDPSDPQNPFIATAQNLPELIFDRIFFYVRSSAWISTLNANEFPSANAPLRNPTGRAHRAASKAIADLEKVCRSWWPAARRLLWREWRCVDPETWKLQMEIVQRDNEGQRRDWEEHQRHQNAATAPSSGRPSRLPWPPLPKPSVIDFSASDAFFSLETLAELVISRWLDMGTLQELHFPQFDRWTRIVNRLDDVPSSYDLESLFCEAEEDRTRELVSPDSPRNDDTSMWRKVFVFHSPFWTEPYHAPSTFSNLRTLTLPVAWEWSSELYNDLVSDNLLETIARRCPNLCEIKAMGGDNITSNGITSLVRGCPKLQVLRIWKAPYLTNHTIGNIAEHCTGLTEFTVSFANKLSPRGIEPLFRLPHFEAIDVTGCRGLLFRRSLFEMLKRTKGYEKMRRLDLSVDFWELDELEALQPDSFMTAWNLADESDVDAQRESLDDNSIRLLESELMNLWTQNGVYTGIDPPHYNEKDLLLGASALSASPLSYLPALRKNHFYSHLSLFQNLTALVLSGHSALTDIRLKMLFPPTHTRSGLRSITRLGLGSCSQITDRGIFWLCSNGPQRIEHLELLRMQDEVTDETLIRIAETWGSYLKVLELSESFGFTQPGLDSFMNALDLIPCRRDLKIGHVRLPVSDTFRERFRNPHAGSHPTVFGWIDWELVEFPVLAADFELSDSDIVSQHEDEFEHFGSEGPDEAWDLGDEEGFTESDAGFFEEESDFADED